MYYASRHLVAKQTNLCLRMVLGYVNVHASKQVNTVSLYVSMSLVLFNNCVTSPPPQHRSPIASTVRSQIRYYFLSMSMSITMH